MVGPMFVVPVKTGQISTVQTDRTVSYWAESEHWPNVLNTQLVLSRISISHISASGAKRRYLRGFIPALERALATIRSHNDRKRGLPNHNKNHRARAKRLNYNFEVRC